jgi:uncharacterized protein (DUF58 family)
VFVSTRLPILVLATSVVAGLLGLGVPAAIVAVLVVAVLCVALDVASATPPAHVLVRRSAPAVASIGRESDVTLWVRNERTRPIAVVVRDATPPSAGRRPRTHRARVPARGASALVSRVTPSRRGSLEIGPATVRVYGALGVAGRQATVGPVDRIRVYPALPARAETALRLERARTLQSGTRSSTYRGGGREFDSLREYHPDDEFRRINWRATARSREPVVNVFREERNQQVLLMLDASRAMAATVAGVPRFEHGLDAAVALADLCSKVGDRVGMVAFASRVLTFLPPRGGSAQGHRILDLLFETEPSLEAPAYLDAFASLLSRARRRSLLVLFTDLTDPAAMSSLFDAVPALLARHLLIVASVTDPDVVEMRDRPPRSSQDAFASAAAAEALAARAGSAARLAAMGAIVEDREPGRLAGAVADRYLRIKGAGRL